MEVKKERRLLNLLCALAERQGFEPWEGCPSTVFKTAAFDRSAISPIGRNISAYHLIMQIFFYTRNSIKDAYNW